MVYFDLLHELTVTVYIYLSTNIFVEKKENIERGDEKNLYDLIFVDS